LREHAKARKRLSIVEMQIRDAIPEDSPTACIVLKRSIAELCEADHRNDPSILVRWLGNKTHDNFCASSCGWPR
jgi:hypothetical protein